MDMIDRYLGSVALVLPTKGREDILTELRDVLMSRMEEKEEALGRPLTQAEQEAVLKDYGHPFLVAGRYAPRQHLIGPAVLPFYMVGLKIGFAILILVQGIHAVTRAIGGDLDRAIPTFVGGMWNGGLVLVGLVTLIAFLVEYAGADKKLTEGWRPSRLPLLHTSMKVRESLWERMFEAVMGAAMLLIWLSAIKVPLHDPSWAIDWAPGAIWTTLYWPVAGLILFQVAMDFWRVVEPGRPIVLGLRGVAALGSAVVMGVLVSNPPIFTLINLSMDPAQFAAMSGLVMTYTDIGLKMALAIVVIGAVVRLVRAWRAARG